jgi:hypothetical protein
MAALVSRATEGEHDKIFDIMVHATRAWGMSGPVRIQEQNRTGSCDSST